MRILSDFIFSSMLWSITSRCCLHCPFHPGYRCTIFTTCRGMRCLQCWFGRMYGFCCDQCRRLISFEGPLHWIVSLGSAWWTVHMQRSWELQCPGLGLCLRWISKLPRSLWIGTGRSVVGAYKHLQQRIWMWTNGSLSCEQAVPTCLTPLLLLALTWVCVLGTVSRLLCSLTQAQTTALYWHLASLLHKCCTWMTCLIAYEGTWNRREQVKTIPAPTTIDAMNGSLLPALGCHEMETAMTTASAVTPGVAREPGAGRGLGLTMHPVVHRRDHLRLYRFMEDLLPLQLVLQTLTFLRAPLIRARSYGRKTFGDVVAPQPKRREAPQCGGRCWVEIALTHGQRRRKILMLRRRKGRKKKNLIRTLLPQTFPGHQTGELDVKWNESSKKLLRRKRSGGRLLLRPPVTGPIRLSLGPWSPHDDSAPG